MTELRERLRNDPLPGEAEAAARSWPWSRRRWRNGSPAAAPGRIDGGSGCGSPSSPPLSPPACSSRLAGGRLDRRPLR